MNEKKSIAYNRLRPLLEEIVDLNPGTIRETVAREALERENVFQFFKDLLQYGCQSGMVGQLIYYADTHQFFDEHYDEIEELRNSIESSFGESLLIKGDLKNFLAWFAFEETARTIAEELGLEI